MLSHCRENSGNSKRQTKEYKTKIWEEGQKALSFKLLECLDLAMPNYINTIQTFGVPSHLNQ